MNRHSKYFVFFLAMMCIPFTVFSQEEGEEEENKNHIAAFIGGTSNSESSGFTLGIDYKYRISQLIGVGGILDHAFGEVNSTIIAPALFLHWKAFEFVVAPGAEYSDDHVAAVLRLGVEYEIVVSGFSISPGLFFDSERDGGASIVYGIGVGYGF